MSVKVDLGLVFLRILMEAKYKGNTNTNTDVIYNDLSDFIVRR